MILFCGETLIDMIPERSASGATGFTPKIGGASLNSAIALGRLGGNAGLFTGISNDLFGTMIKAELKASLVSTAHLARFDAPCSLAFIALNDGNASYTFYTNGAADTILKPQDCPDDSTDIDALLFGGISLCKGATADTMAGFLQKRAPHSVIMIDPNIRTTFIDDEPAYRARLAQMFASSDIIKLSDEDLAWLVPQQSEIPQQISALLPDCAKLVLVTKGADGAAAYFNGACIAEVSAQPVQVADTVGAGDTFNAGVLFKLQQAAVLNKAFCTRPDAGVLKAAMQFAAKAAAITVSRSGANPPWAQELDGQ